MSRERQVFTVAITGASGAAIGIRALELLRDVDRVESHLIVSAAGALTIRQETSLTLPQVEALADVTHKNVHIGASLASGSRPVAGMVVAPCSVRTLSAVAHGLTDNLVSRAADVCLKERRPLLLLVRESPVHAGHLASMKMVADLGGIIAFPVPAFYRRPHSVEEVVDDIARRALVRVGVAELASEPWRGVPEDVRQPSSFTVADVVEGRDWGQAHAVPHT